MYFLSLLGNRPWIKTINDERKWQTSTLFNCTRGYKNTQFDGHTHYYGNWKLTARPQPDQELSPVPIGHEADGLTTHLCAIIPMAAIGVLAPFYHKDCSHFEDVYSACI
jgi:hypothetical protein